MIHHINISKYKVLLLIIIVIWKNGYKHIGYY